MKAIAKMNIALKKVKTKNPPQPRRPYQEEASVPAQRSRYRTTKVSNVWTQRLVAGPVTHTSVEQGKVGTADPTRQAKSTTSKEASREYVHKLSIGGTIAIYNTDGGKRDYWLASKQSQIRIASSNDNTTGVKKGDAIVSIVWYERVAGVKFKKLDYETIVGVSSALVTVSNISWHKVTTNRYYLGETIHTRLLDIVSTMSEL